MIKLFHDLEPIGSLNERNFIPCQQTHANYYRHALTKINVSILDAQSNFFRLNTISKNWVCKQDYPVYDKATQLTGLGISHHNR